MVPALSHLIKLLTLSAASLEEPGIQSGITIIGSRHPCTYIDISTCSIFFSLPVTRASYEDVSSLLSVPGIAYCAVEVKNRAAIPCCSVCTSHSLQQY